MHQIASALGDDARWRMVELLAERPRSVGELAGDYSVPRLMNGGIGDTWVLA